MDPLFQWNHIQLNGDLPQISNCQSGWNWKPPPLFDCDFWCVLKGSGTLTVEGKSLPLEEGRVFIFLPQSQPEAYQDAQNPLSVFWGHFSFCNEKQQVSVLKTHEPYLTRNLQNISRFSQLAEECVQRFLISQTHHDPYGLSLFSYLLCHVMASPEEEASSPPWEETLRHLAHEIQLEPGQEWGLDSMAYGSGMSRSSFTRRFRKLFQQSPNDYIIYQRVKRASYLLRETSMTLEAISEELGYSDVYYFHKQFRARMGITPGTFRKQKASLSNFIKR